MIALLAVVWAAEPTPPIRMTDGPALLDADDRPVAWSAVRDIARETDAMRRVRGRRVGRAALRVLFTGAAAAEVWATTELVQADSDWAWAMGAQAGFTGLAAGLLWADIPRSRRVDRAEMLDAANAWLRVRPTPP